MFSLIFAWTDDWVNNREAGDLRRHHTHYVMTSSWLEVDRLDTLRSHICRHRTGLLQLLSYTLAYHHTDLIINETILLICIILFHMTYWVMCIKSICPKVHLLSTFWWDSIPLHLYMWRINHKSFFTVAIFNVNQSQLWHESGQCCKFRIP